MAAGGNFTSDGPGGRASRFLVTVVAFVTGFFQYVFHFFVPFFFSAKIPHDNQQHQERRSNSSETGTKDSHLVPSHDGDLTNDLTKDLANDPASMQRQLQRRPMAATSPQQPYGLKQTSANGQSAKVAVPLMPTSASGRIKQENLPANGITTKTKDRGIPNGVEKRLVSGVNGEEAAKENRREQLTLPPPVEPVNEEDEEPEIDSVQAAERAVHMEFIHQALDMARLALKTNETPVGCVLVHNGRVIARGMNATNITRNGTRHAELMALTALLSFTPDSDVEKEKPKKKSKRSKKKRPNSRQSDDVSYCKTYTEQEWGDVDPKDGHIYPYGQKLHPAPRVDRSLIRECTLYVTVEPCVMCASMLRQYGIKKVFFGAVNDKFGGTGGVFCIHMNSDPAHPTTAPTTPIHRPVANQLPRPFLPHKSASCASSISGSQEGPAPAVGEMKSLNGITFTEPPVPKSNMSIGHGGNVEDGFGAEGGWGRDDAVNLLRQFYVQENGRAPVPRKKEGRAARLAAMMESQGMSTEGTALQGLLQQEREAMLEAMRQNSADGGVDTPEAVAELARLDAALEEEKAKANRAEKTESVEAAQASRQDVRA